MTSATLEYLIGGIAMELFCWDEDNDRDYWFGRISVQHRVLTFLFWPYYALRFVCRIARSVYRITKQVIQERKER